MHLKPPYINRICFENSSLDMFQKKNVLTIVISKEISNSNMNLASYSTAIPSPTGFNFLLNPNFISPLELHFLRY